jgi:opacity protein-like surface antigen
LHIQSEVDAMNASKTLIAALTALVIGSTAAVAAAQTTVTPFAGGTFGGDAPEGQLGTGVSLAFFGDYAGFEAELGYTPDFFAEGDDDEIIIAGDSNVTTLMGNLLVGYQRGVLRPYAAVGAGLLRTHIDGGDLFDDVSENDFGFNVGAGVIGMLSEHIGLRGDLRYFRGFTDDDADDEVDLEVGDFDFWRGYAGVTFSF